MDILLKILLYALLLSMSWEDFQKREVANAKTLSFLLLSFLLSFSEGVPWQNSIVSMALFPFPLLFLYGYLSDYCGKEVLGFGDIKALMGFGAALSSLELWKTFYAFYLLSFSLASLFGLYLFFRFRKKEVPMLPFFSMTYCLLDACL